MPDVNVLENAALKYAANSLNVFPVNEHTKAPYTTNGMKDATTDPTTITQWWRQHPTALIGCRIPEDRVILDVDPRHGGDEVWAELERHAGIPLTAGRIHVSGRGDGGRHLWFLRPIGKLSARGLHEWAEKNGVGRPSGKRSWTSGIDILHYGHRYTILPPSPHPDTGQPYTWEIEGRPGQLPEPLAALIVATPAPISTPIRVVRDTDSIADWYTTHHSWHDILPTAGWVIVDGGGDEDGAKWRHPNASAESSASVRHGCLFVYSDNTDFDVTEDGDPHGITRFRAWAILEHDGNLSEAARRAREIRDGPTRRHHTTTTETTPSTDWLNLPEEFWAARPILRHIRQAAHSRIRCADAVFLFALARALTLIPPTVMLPPIAGGKASLNFIGAVVSRSGGGKSSAGAVARELIPIDRKDIVADVPPGSGEGLAELFLEMVSEEGPDGKNRQVKRQTKTGAYVYLDEGHALNEMGKRTGSTLLSQLRTAWSGETLGQSNATKETFRVIKDHKYRLALMVGFQLQYAAELLADNEAGTPQRFVYVNATDPTIPDRRPDWPGEITLNIPLVIPTGTIMEFDADIAAEIEQRALLTSRGTEIPDALDAHRDLVRMKVAAALAILDNRLNVTVQDWHLAGMVMRTSSAVRAWCFEYADHQLAQKEKTRTDAAARREAALDDDATRRALISGAKSIARRVHNLGGEVDRGTVTRAASSKHKLLVAVDDMVSYAETEGWIVALENGWKPGEVRPV